MPSAPRSRLGGPGEAVYRAGFGYSRREQRLVIAMSMTRRVKVAISSSIDASDFAAQPVARIKLPPPCSIRFSRQLDNGVGNVPAMAVKWLDEPEAHDYGRGGGLPQHARAEKDALDKTVAGAEGCETRVSKGQGHPARGRAGAAAGEQRPTSGRIWVKNQRRQETLADPARAGQRGRRVCAADRRRLSPGVRELSHSDENTNIPCHLVSWQ